MRERGEERKRRSMCVCERKIEGGREKRREEARKEEAREEGGRG